MSLTVDELEALIAKVEKTLNCNLYWGRNSHGTWFACPHQCDTTSDNVDGVTLPEVIAKLREWATPPKPATLTIEVPFSWVKSRVYYEYFQPGVSDAVDAICREALKPWTQS